jgi:hypothetical protein
MKSSFDLRDSVCTLCQCTPLDGDECLVGKKPVSASTGCFLTSVPVFGTHANEGQLDSFKYPYYRPSVLGDHHAYSDRRKLDQLRFFLFHVERLYTLYICEYKCSIAQLWCLGSVLNPLGLPQTAGHRRKRERRLAQELLKFDDDEKFTRVCFHKCHNTARDGLDLLFRLPVEIQCQIAGEAFPCAYISIAITLATVPLLGGLENGRSRRWKES